MGSSRALRSDPQDNRTLRPPPLGALGANMPGPSRDPGCLLPPCVSGWGLPASTCSAARVWLCRQRRGVRRGHPAPPPWATQKEA